MNKLVLCLIMCFAFCAATQAMNQKKCIVMCQKSWNREERHAFMYVSSKGAILYDSQMKNNAARNFEACIKKCNEQK